jgi:hypothetical protein
VQSVVPQARETMARLQILYVMILSDFAVNTNRRESDAGL